MYEFRKLHIVCCYWLLISDVAKIKEINETNKKFKKKTRKLLRFWGNNVKRITNLYFFQYAREHYYFKRKTVKHLPSRWDWGDEVFGKEDCI